MRFTGARVTGLLIFLAYLVPPSILFIPLAFIVFKVGIFNSRLALILTYPTFLIPFCTWLLMGYFRSIPFELEESALVDGASRWQILTRVILPLAVPGLISAGIFAFTLSWNEFIYALTFISSSENKTVPVGVLTELVRGDIYEWGALMSGRACRLAAGGDPLLLLRRLLRLVDDRRREGIAFHGSGLRSQIEKRAAEAARLWRRAHKNYRQPRSNSRRAKRARHADAPRRAVAQVPTGINLLNRLGKRACAGPGDTLRPGQVLERRVHARVQHLPPPERPRQRLDHRVVDPRPRRPLRAVRRHHQLPPAALSERHRDVDGDRLAVG